MRNKTSGLFILILFTISIIPLSFAEVGGDVTRTATPTLYATNTAAPVESAFLDIRRIVANSETGEECVLYGKREFPRADPTRIKELCKRAIDIRSDPEKLADYREKREELVSRIQDNVREEYRYRLKQVLADNPEYEEKIRNLSEEELKKLSLLHREKAKRIVDTNTKEKIREDLKNYVVKTVRKENLYQKRIVAENRYEEARKKYAQAKNRYEEAKDNYTDAKKRFEERVREGDEEGAREEAKKFLIHASDMIISSLEKIKENAEGNDDLTEEEYLELISEIDAKLAEVEDLKSQVEDAETKEEIKELASQINAKWARIKSAIKYHSANAFKSKVGEIFVKSEQLQAKLERILSHLEEVGIDVEDIDLKVDDFDALLSSAKDEYESGVALYREAFELRKNNGSIEEINALVEDAKTKIRSAHESLKEAHNLLMEIAREIKVEKPDVSFEDDEDEVEVEVIEEVEA
ncbi:hypothetical protein GOV05_03210 [Candidatus Woesearchaeota archaeon]|nr:hypothetical protein [Candidatus Woesearchaeota archaeon]